MSEDREKELTAKQAEVDKVNEGRKVDSDKKDAEGNVVKVFPKGTLLKMSQTRGKNPQIVQYEAFHLDKPETLPTSLDEFMKLSGIEKAPNAEALLVGYAIDGFNDSQYSAASDPIAEYVNAAWPEEMQKGFRLAVRNYSNATGLSIEDAANLIKPGIEKAFSAKSV